MRENISVRQWQENYRAGAYRSKDVDIQRAAGWQSWICQNDAMAGRLKHIAPMVTKIKEPLLLDNYRVQFVNAGTWRKAIYDSVRFAPLDAEKDDIRCFKVDFRSPKEPDIWTLYTKRFGYHAPEFSCDDTDSMVSYIANLVRELEQGVRPAILDERAVAVEYSLRRNAPYSDYTALRQEGKHCYSFRDLKDGQRKMIYVTQTLSDKIEQINGLYVFCPGDAENPLKKRSRGIKGAPKKKKEVER